jgi:hypothetical protein
MLGYGQNPDLPPQVVEAFNTLAEEQRGRPENAMLDAVHALGGGVLSYIVEHVGDLTNRMANKWHLSDGGYEYIHDKVGKTLRTLRHGYGFTIEHEENMRGNAKYNKEPYLEYVLRANTLLLDYADAHAQLVVYNRAQYCARGAAIALGVRNFKRAEALLAMLEKHLANIDDWTEFAIDYRLNADGSVRPYPWR